MKVLIVHQDVIDETSKDIQDVIKEASFIKGCLEEAGHTVELYPHFGKNLENSIGMIMKYEFDIIFNLVEDVAGCNSLNPIGAMVFDCLRLPYTGSPHSTLAVTTDKVLTKNILLSSGLPTSPMIRHSDRALMQNALDKYIIKPISEDGSVGITDESVVTSNLSERFDALGPMAYKYFAEKFVDGREIFVPLIYSKQRRCMSALPPCEFVYDFPEGKPRILNYSCKWDEDSFEDEHTIKTYEFKPQDKSMLEYLQFLSEKCARLFNLKGYARIDFRIANEGDPFAVMGKACILEINTNPHMSEYSIMYESAVLGGYSKADMVNAILEDANGR